MKIMGNMVQDSNSCPPRIMELLLDHRRNSKESKHGRRWSKNIVRLRLKMWCHSPQAYSDLRSSRFLLFTFNYKNKLHQKVGIIKEILHWMENEAVNKNIPPEGNKGGLMLDKKSIQSDLQFHWR